jgi:hypothetical protein
MSLTRKTAEHSRAACCSLLLEAEAAEAVEAAVAAVEALEAVAAVVAEAAEAVVAVEAAALEAAGAAEGAVAAVSAYHWEAASRVRSEHAPDFDLLTPSKNENRARRRSRPASPFCCVFVAARGKRSEHGLLAPRRPDTAFGRRHRTFREDGLSQPRPALQACSVS